MIFPNLPKRYHHQEWSKQVTSSCFPRNSVFRCLLSLEVDLALCWQRLGTNVCSLARRFAILFPNVFSETFDLVLRSPGPELPPSQDSGLCPHLREAAEKQHELAFVETSDCKWNLCPVLKRMSPTILRESCMVQFLYQFGGSEWSSCEVIRSCLSPVTIVNDINDSPCRYDTWSSKYGILLHCVEAVFRCHGVLKFHQGKTEWSQ